MIISDIIRLTQYCNPQNPIVKTNQWNLEDAAAWAINLNNNLTLAGSATLIIGVSPAYSHVSWEIIVSIQS